MRARDNQVRRDILLIPPSSDHTADRMDANGMTRDKGVLRHVRDSQQFRRHHGVRRTLQRDISVRAGNSVLSITRTDFRLILPKRRQFFASIGLLNVAVATLLETRIDDNCQPVVSTWATR